MAAPDRVGEDGIASLGDMFWLLMLLVVAPLVELYVIVQVSGTIGFLSTLALLVIIAAVGAALVKAEGLRVWKRFDEQVRAGQIPEREIVDGVLILVGGALMLAPGFVSDVIALLLVVPFTRALPRSLLLRRRAARSTRVRVVRATYGGPMDGRGRGAVTDTTATEVHGELDRRDDDRG